MTNQFTSSYGTVGYGIVGEGSPLVLVHGTPWSSFNWRHVLPALSQWFTVYFYDLLGYGESDKPDGDVSLGVQNEVLAELLDHWKLADPIVIGHDFGGTTVLRTHLLNKREFQKMILIDPVAMAPWGSAFFSHVNQYESAFQGVPGYIHQAMVAAYVQSAQFKPMTEETLAGILKPWLGPAGQPAFYRQIAQASQRYTDEIEDQYGRIQIPTLIAWGEQDQWIPLEKGLKLHHELSSSQFVAIPDAGHLVQEDQPAILLAHILKFLVP